MELEFNCMNRCGVGIRMRMELLYMEFHFNCINICWTGQVGDVKALLVNEGQGNNVYNRIVDYIDHWYIGYC